LKIIETKNFIIFLKRLPSLFSGLFLFAIGIVANLHSNLGMSPWGVLNVGISNVTPITFGQASQLVGLAVIVVDCFLGFAPGFGTLANMFFIGFFIDLIISWNLIPVQTELLGQLGLLATSILIFGLASLLYMRVQLGAGPRDSLMIGLVKKFDNPVIYVRSTVEVIVCLLGYLMSGPVGLGTLITALTIGPSVHFFFKLGRFNSKSEQMNLLRLYQFLKNEKT
jgi:uncharacterized membrane protein YczE